MTPPEKVEHALRRFFTEKNLVALRQLALREVANAVERRARRSPEEESGAVAAERVMVSMSSQPGATRRLLRQGARLAGGLASRWLLSTCAPATSTSIASTPRACAR